jgi:hypothetical protein
MDDKVNFFRLVICGQRLAQDICLFRRARDVDFLSVWSEEMAEPFACMVEMVRPMMCTCCR